jgi:hypothetical protein
MSETKVDFTLLDVDTTQYSLEDDQNLFTVLTSFSNYVTERTTQIQREVNETSESAKRLEVKLVIHLMIFYVLPIHSLLKIVFTKKMIVIQKMLQKVRKPKK